MFEGILSPQLLLVGLLAILVVVLKELTRKTNSGRSKGKSRSKVDSSQSAGTGKGLKRYNDAADQLRTVMNADFKSRPLLNQPEAKVFKALDEAVVERNPQWQVMAQVSLGEFLSSKSRKAFFSVNSKRVDFALMDENCEVIHALEYQGTGHHLSDNTAARDAVKKEALRKAGIGYHEIVAGHTTAGELRALVEKLVPSLESASSKSDGEQVTQLHPRQFGRASRAG
ncbi:MAG: DUF2726 domain-containing protein [Erythrobacter sp.]